MHVNWRCERDTIISPCKQIFFASRNGLLGNVRLQELGIFFAVPAVTRRRASLTRTQLRKEEGGERLKATVETRQTLLFSSGHSSDMFIFRCVCMPHTWTRTETIQIRCATHTLNPINSQVSLCCHKCSSYFQTLRSISHSV